MSPTNSTPRTEPGIVVGGCELVRRIGRGGMAEVWVARRALGTKGSKFVAIKLMADHYVGDERYARMFRSEAELAAVLSHANIVQVFDEGEEDGRSWLVMEWVDGINLLKLGAVLALLDDEQRRLRVIAYIIGQLLHALHYAHSITSADGNPLGVVHRDVSPQNVLVSNHGEVKLTDFGVAHHALEESSGVHVKGKVRYMSPEQLSGCTRSPTVDLYAVGALLHELLDGRRFRGEHEDGQELFAAVLSGRVAPLSRPVPPELDHLRLRLLEPDPKQRIQTATEGFGLLERYPGYGDARNELTKLCGSVTGVLRPRAGLGGSKVDKKQVEKKQVEKKPWRTGHGVAKPKLHLEARHPGSLSAARAQQPVSHAGSHAGPHAGPRTCSAVAARSAEAAAADTALAGGTVIATARALQHVAQPVVGANPARSDDEPTPSVSGPEGDAGQRRSPTERLVRASTANARRAELELLLYTDAGSETDASPYLEAHGRMERAPTGRNTALGGEEPGAYRPSESVIARWGRAALAGRGSAFVLSWRSVLTAGLGMVLVVAISASTAWWLVRAAETTEAARPTGGLEAMNPTTELLWHEIGRHVDSSHDRPNVVARERVRPSAPPLHGDRVDLGDRGDPADRDEPSVAPHNPTDRVRPTAPKPAPRKTKPAPSVLVKVRGGMGLDRAQVKVASRTVSVGERREVLVTAGRKRLEWRAHERDAWKPAGAWRFEPGTTVMAFVTKEGLKLRTLP